MIGQSILFPDNAKLYVIGESSTPGIYQYAMLISENPTQEDRGLKNAVLFKCGMHGREWYAAESCYWLIDHLLGNLANPVVQELLANVDVWVIPQSNPAGRFIDDLRGGDPTQFAYVCDTTAPVMNKIGDPCITDVDCGGSGCYTNGWRANANRTTCELGVDPGRNFSSGWDDAPDKCNDPDNIMQFRGTDPFSELETLNLRSFVNNHMLSMVAISHTTAQKIWNNWNSMGSLATDYITDWLVNTNLTGGTAYTPNPALTRDQVGTGSGQFSAWLTEPSDVLGEPDFGTERNISTFYFELPFDEDNPANNYYNTMFENAPGDGSNSFHPSGTAVENYWNDAIRPLLLFLIRQARSPQCPVEDTRDVSINAECEAEDFGLVGAKIADRTDQPGLLSYDLDTRREILPQGAHKVVFAVQNFSKNRGKFLTPTSTHATVQIFKDGGLVDDRRVRIALRPGERTTFTRDYDFGIGNYEISILLDKDDFLQNNLKIFKFKVPSPFPPSYGQVSPGTTLSQRIDTEGWLSYEGLFYPEQFPDPRKADLKLVLYGHRAHLPGSQFGSTSVSYLLPKGSPWWDKSIPAKGLWIYSDPRGLNSAVRSLTIKRSTNSATGYKIQTEVSLTARDKKLKALIGAQSYRFDLNFTGANLRLSSLAQGTRPEPLLNRPLPDDETVQEP
jgi:hypothetical protein